MSDACVFATTRSWTSSLFAGVVALFLGALLFLEPALTIRLLLYSLGIIAVGVAVLLFAGAAFFSRGGGPVVPLLLVIGILVLALGILAFLKPDLVGGFLAVIAAALLIVGGLGIAVTGVFQGPTFAGRVLSVIGGLLLAILGFLFLFHTGVTATLVVRLVGIFLFGAGAVFLAGAFLWWWRGRGCGPEWIDAEVAKR